MTSAWTAVNTSKEYRCKGILGDGTHTRFSSPSIWHNFNIRCKIWFNATWNVIIFKPRPNLFYLHPDIVDTRFWETDRTKSTFSIPCLPDGTFNFVDAPESWPICLEDIECLEDPPYVPSHPDYAVITGGAPGLPRVLRDVGQDDGQAFVNSLIYPQRRVQLVHKSLKGIWDVFPRDPVSAQYNSTSNNRTALPKNYMANLT